MLCRAITKRAAGRCKDPVAAVVFCRAIVKCAAGTCVDAVDTIGSCSAIVERATGSRMDAGVVVADYHAIVQRRAITSINAFPSISTRRAIGQRRTRTRINAIGPVVPCCATTDNAAFPRIQDAILTIELYNAPLDGWLVSRLDAFEQPFLHGAIDNTQIIAG